MEKYKVTFEHKTDATKFDAEWCEAENKAAAIKKVKARLKTWNNIFTSHFTFKASEAVENDKLTIGYVNEFGQ